MALTSNEFYLKISVYYKVKIIILGCLISDNFGYKKVVTTCYNVKNCLRYIFSCGCFTRYFCDFTKSKSLFIIFDNRQLY